MDAHAAPSGYVCVYSPPPLPLPSPLLAHAYMQDILYMYIHAGSGDWGLGRIAAFNIKGAEGMVFDSNTLHKLDGNAMLVEGYNRDVTIQVPPR